MVLLAEEEAGVNRRQAWNAKSSVASETQGLWEDEGGDD
jgi:hypothetical protein